MPPSPAGSAVVFGRGKTVEQFLGGKTTNVDFYLWMKREVKGLYGQSFQLAFNIARKAAAVQRVLGELPSSVRLVPLDFEHDDVLTVLADHGYRPDYRTFFVWEAVTQYLTADAVHATLEGLRSVAPGSRLVFTYVRRDFIDGVNLYGAESLYRRFRQRQQLWHFGLQPE